MITNVNLGEPITIRRARGDIGEGVTIVAPNGAEYPLAYAADVARFTPSSAGTWTVRRGGYDQAITVTDPRRDAASAAPARYVEAG
jgi:hypothetical protein